MKSDTNELETDHAVIASLFQFRLVTAEQLQQLHAPGVGIKQTQRRLRRLEAEGLAAELTLPQSGRRRAWFLTEYGCKVAATFPELADVPGPRLPGDPLGFKYTKWHLLDVVRTHVAFLADARRHEDAYRPLDFTPEIVHRFAEGRDGTLRPDGLLHYCRNRDGGGRSHLRAFVEVDRATMASERLCAKLTGYARYHRYSPLPAGVRAHTVEGQQGRTPSWTTRYPRFPRLLFVLTNTGPTGIDHRIADLQLSAREDQPVRDMLRTVKAGAARLEDLEEHGPAAAVWHPLADDERAPCGWHEL